MRYNASAFFDQSNAEAKNASAHYMRKFWGQSIPPKELTELDVYDAVKSNFYEPHELTFALSFVAFPMTLSASLHLQTKSLNS